MNGHCLFLFTVCLASVLLDFTVAGHFWKSARNRDFCFWTSSISNGQKHYMFLHQTTVGKERPFVLFDSIWNKENSLVDCITSNNRAFIKSFSSKCWKARDRTFSDIPDGRFNISILLEPDGPCVALGHLPEMTVAVRRARDLDIMDHKTIYQNSGESSQKLKRSKRAWMIPGTLWCGSGSKASNFSDLGLFEETDKCCREHDHCDQTIASFEFGYGVFNTNFFTLSHCNCDSKFRRCLHHANDSMSDMVGYGYFNLLKMRCFEFSQRMECAERSWWGMCKHSQMTTYAMLRDATGYNSTFPVLEDDKLELSIHHSVSFEDLTLTNDLVMSSDTVAEDASEKHSSLSVPQRLSVAVDTSQQPEPHEKMTDPSTTDSPKTKTIDSPHITTDSEQTQTADPPYVQTTDPPYVQTTDSPHVQTTDSPHVQTTDSPHVQTTDSPRIQTTDPPHVQTTDLPHRQTTDSPHRQTTDSPHVQTTDSPHVQTTDSPHVQTTDSPHVQTTDSPRIQTTDPPHVQTTDLPHRQTTDSPHRQTTDSPHVQTTDSPRIQTTDPPHVQITDSPHRQTTDSPHVQTTDSPHVQITDPPHVQTTDSPRIQTADSPHIQTTDTPCIETTDSPRIQTTDSPHIQTTDSPHILTVSSKIQQTKDSPKTETKDSPQEQTDSSRTQTTNAPKTETDAGTTDSTKTQIPDSSKTQTDSPEIKTTGSPKTDTTDSLKAQTRDLPVTKITDSAEAETTDTPQIKITLSSKPQTDSLKTETTEAPKPQTDSPKMHIHPEVHTRQKGKLDACESYKDLDSCRYQIPAQREKFGLRNAEHTTLYHCNCTSRLARELAEEDEVDKVHFWLLDFVSQSCFLLPQNCTGSESCSTSSSNDASLIERWSKGAAVWRHLAAPRRKAKRFNSRRSKRKDSPIRLHKKCLRMHSKLHIPKTFKRKEVQQLYSN